MGNEQTNEASVDLIGLLRAQHEAVFGEAACPDWVKDSLKRFVDQGIPTGDFLRAVLANDLQGAFGRADIQTAKVMAAIVSYVYRHIPSSIIGSYEAVDDRVRRRLEELRAAREAAEPAQPQPVAEPKLCDDDSAELGPCVYEAGHVGMHSWMPF